MVPHGVEHRGVLNLFAPGFSHWATGNLVLHPLIEMIQGKDFVDIKLSFRNRLRLLG